MCIQISQPFQSTEKNLLSMMGFLLKTGLSGSKATIYHHPWQSSTSHHLDTNMVRLTIYWITNDRATNNKIRERFGIPYTMTVNGETEADIREEDMPLLEETQKRGFIQIRYKPNQTR